MILFAKLIYLNYLCNLFNLNYSINQIFIKKSHEKFIEFYEILTKHYIII